MSTTKYWIKKMHEEKIIAYNAYTDLPFILRILRRFHLHYKLPFYSIWFSSWKSQINKYSTIILFANKMNIPILYWLRNKYPQTRIIFWYWNPIIDSVNPIQIPDGICEKWSFDLQDCKTYHLNYNTTFYLKSFVHQYKRNVKAEFDVFFVGEDKGRLSYLNSLEIKMNKLGITTYFHIVYKGYGYRKTFDYKENISYGIVLDYINKSKAILEVLQNGQSGLTLRAMESLFFERKLITNNSLIKTCDFYNPSNIFILDEDDIALLPEFISTTYIPLDLSVVEQYSIQNWLSRF